MHSRVANRYALALIGLADEHKMLDKIAEDMHAIQETLHASRELRVVLSSPVVTPDKKQKVLHELFEKQLSKQTLLFVDLLVRKGRAEYLVATADQFLAMLDDRRGIVPAQIKSANELSEEQQMQVQAKLERMTGKRIRPKFSVDPELRGGFVARIGDELVDASLAHQLEALREQFKHGGAPILN
jgi:F-type H+-transporting ATPase subunit delta